MSKKRTYIEVSQEIAYQVRLYCFFKQVNTKEWLDNLLKKELEPFIIIIKSNNQLK